MSQIFHKSCYTSRSTGYKYRTLSTNTGEKKRRDSREDSTFDHKLKELRREISTRVDKELGQAQRARAFINEKLEKIENKIDTMIELQKDVAAMRSDLHVTEATLNEMEQRIGKLDLATRESELYSLHSQKDFFRSPPIFEEQEIFASDVTDI